jgi:hypothetical protein
MHIKAGYEIAYDCPAPTPMLLVLSIHPTRLPDLVTPQRIEFDRDVFPYDYVDASATSARESSSHRAGPRYAPTSRSPIRARLTSSRRRRGSTRSSSCRTMRWFFCSEAAIARPIA